MIFVQKTFKHLKILIIISKGHWEPGWFISPSDLKAGVHVLEKAGIRVITEEVESLAQLENMLDSVAPHTLIWPNTYFVKDGDKLVWMNDCIEARNLPYIGSSAQTLKEVLKKEHYQSLLKKHKIPVPNSCVIGWDNVLELEDLIFENNIKIPFVLKPTTELGSIEIGKANNAKEAKEYVYQVLNDYPDSSILIKGFLENDDIICGYMQLGDEYLLLPSYPLDTTSGKQNRASSNDSLPLSDIELSVLNQLKVSVSTIVEIFNIKGITSVYGKLDEKGQLRFFDLYGITDLSISSRFMAKQCLACFPDYTETEVYEAFLHTIIYDAALHYAMNVPMAVKNHHLFMMKSDWVVKRTG